MDAGLAAIIGAIVGGVLAIAGNVILHILQTRREVSLNVRRRERLKQMLGGNKYKWRSIGTLAASIGADENDTKALLLEIEARASLTNKDSWSLISRSPYPEDMQPED